jgi:exopolysaccharide biosynthesis polyprenyl glycosylphosphotransferase
MMAVLALDATIVVISACFAVALEAQLDRQNFFDADSFGQYLPLASTFAILTFVTYISWRVYPSLPEHLRLQLRDLSWSLLACNLTGVALYAAWCAAGYDAPALGLLLPTMVACILVLGVRWVLPARQSGGVTGVPLRNAVIVGTGDEAQVVKHQMQHFRRFGYRFSGFVAATPRDRHSQVSKEVVADIDTFFHQKRQSAVDEIFLTAPYDQTMVERLLPNARRAGMDVRIAPDREGGDDIGRGGAYVTQFLALPLQRSELNRAARIQKRALDVAISAAAILLSAVPMLAIALLIKIDSPGPVFYRSRRAGRRGRIFLCTKFRTMTPDSATQDEMRVTRAGKFLRAFSLQELPQVFDVFWGNMSLVGPRPALASETPVSSENYLRRLEVTPGITGLWQVQPGEPDMYVSLDRTYVQNWSVWLDLKILARTFAGVLNAK